jgi:hypothetical protein
MTTSSAWEPDPTTTPQHEATPIADELSAAGSTDTSADSSSSDTSAKERAQEAASTAKEQGAEVAATAADEAKHLASEATAKASDLLADVRAQVDEQSRTQLNGLASKLGELGDELDGLIRGDGQTEGTVTDLARQLSDRTRALSNHLSEREPSDLVADVRSFARRRPGAFLVGAAAAGLLAGRLTRGAKKANDTSTTTSSATTGSATPTTTAPVTTAPVTTTTTSTYATDTSVIGAEVPLGQNTGGPQ